MVSTDPCVFTSESHGAEQGIESTLVMNNFSWIRDNVAIFLSCRESY